MFGNLFSLSFWFKSAVLMTSSVRILMGIFGLLIVVGIFSMIMIILKKKNVLLIKFFKKLSIFSFTMCFLGLMVLFFNYERLPLLSSRIWFLFWGIGLIVWLVFVLKYWFVRIPKMKREIDDKKEFEKYLP